MVLAINTVDPELIADGLLDIPIAAIPVDNHTDDHHRLLARREGWSLVRLETGVNSVARDGNVVYVATLFSAYILNKTTLHEIDCGTSGVTVIDDLLVLNGTLCALTGAWLLPCASSAPAINLGRRLRRIAATSAGYVGIASDGGELLFTRSLNPTSWKAFGNYRYGASSSLHATVDAILVTMETGMVHWLSTKSGTRVSGRRSLEPVIDAYDILWTARTVGVVVGYERNSLIPVLYAHSFE